MRIIVEIKESMWDVGEMLALEAIVRQLYMELKKGLLSKDSTRPSGKLCVHRERCTMLRLWS